MRKLVFFSLAGLCAVVLPCQASDVWETLHDDSSSTGNMLRPGLPQLHHDLEGTDAAPDQDWMVVVTKPDHSYAARVTGGSSWQALPQGPHFDRVDASGNVLTPGVIANDDTHNFNFARGLTVRWISQSPVEYLRAAPEGAVFAGPTYDVEFYDTTLFVPRFNNSATQTTVFVIQNTTDTTVNGLVYFHDAAGALLFSVALSVVEHGVQVFNTAAIPALAGKSGSATIAQLGGYGALTGKAVAVEPATGFTFDTAITPVPR